MSADGDRKNAVWLPKSLVEIERKPKTVVVTLPENLAIETGIG